MAESCISGPVLNRMLDDLVNLRSGQVLALSRSDEYRERFKYIFPDDPISKMRRKCAYCGRPGDGVQCDGCGAWH